MQNVSIVLGNVCKCCKHFDRICFKFGIGEVQKNVNPIDLFKRFPTSIRLRKSASIQPRASPTKFGSQISQITCVESVDHVPNVNFLFTKATEYCFSFSSLFLPKRQSKSADHKNLPIIRRTSCKCFECGRDPYYGSFPSLLVSCRLTSFQARSDAIQS